MPVGVTEPERVGKRLKLHNAVIRQVVIVGVSQPSDEAVKPVARMKSVDLLEVLAVYGKQIS